MIQSERRAWLESRIAERRGEARSVYCSSADGAVYCIHGCMLVSAIRLWVFVDHGAPYSRQGLRLGIPTWSKLGLKLKPKLVPSWATVNHPIVPYIWDPRISGLFLKKQISHIFFPMIGNKGKRQTYIGNFPGLPPMAFIGTTESLNFRNTSSTLSILRIDCHFIIGLFQEVTLSKSQKGRSNTGSMNAVIQQSS